MAPNVDPRASRHFTTTGNKQKDRCVVVGFKEANSHLEEGNKDENMALDLRHTSTLPVVPWRTTIKKGSLQVRGEDFVW